MSAVTLGYLSIALMAAGLGGFAWCVFRAPVREDLARVDEDLDELAPARRRVDVAPLSGRNEARSGSRARVLPNRGRGETLEACRECGAPAYCDCAQRHRCEEIEEQMTW